MAIGSPPKFEEAITETTLQPATSGKKPKKRFFVMAITFFV
jgi:hypothetical protein